jgi:hypothetical protein
MIMIMLIAFGVTALTGSKTPGSEGQGPLADDTLFITRLAHANGDEH